MTSWSVICFANEQPEHLRAFVAWHLGSGAREVQLMLDKPNSALVQELAGVPNLRVRSFQNDYWQDNYGRNDLNRVDRHRILATQAYRAATSDWVLHIDADEFIYADGDIARLLADVPNHTHAIRIAAADRLLASTDADWPGDKFRMMTNEKYPAWLSEIYKFPNQFNFGLRGHSNGKLFVRGGKTDIELMPHRLIGPDQKRVHKNKWSEPFTLLHMFVYDFAHFQRKGEWKFNRGPGNRKRDLAIENPTPRDLRRIEMSDIFLKGDTEKQHEIFADLFVFSDERLARLRQFQSVRQFDFTAKLSKYLQQYFP